MKRILLSTMVVGMLLIASCKGEKKEEVKAIEEVKTEVKKTVEANKAKGKTVIIGVEIPSFSNKAVETNLKLYALHARKYVKEKGDVAKITAMASRGKKLLDKGREMVSKLSKEEQEMYAEVIANFQSKMQEAN